MKYALIKVPTSLGASMLGAELGPDAITAFLTKTFKQQKTVIIQKCKRCSIKKKHFDCIKSNNTRIKAAIKGVLKKKLFPITVGGDHTLTAGAVAGVAAHYKNIGLLYVDAHGDFNTPKTSPSGNVHGMVVSEIACNGFCNISGDNPVVQEKNIVLIGIRDIDKGEKKRLQQSKITYFSMAEVKKQGMARIMTKAIKIASKNTKGFYLSIDVDSLSPQIAPGTGYRVPRGINKKDIITIIKKTKKAKILGFDIVEVNPKRDINNKTAKLAAELIHLLIS